MQMISLSSGQVEANDIQELKYMMKKLIKKMGIILNNSRHQNDIIDLK